ncbi:MAG: hypothetical protein KDJ96_07435 [Rhodobacteraceae bacterium]|nr:hypothetical protein [Paracoccaceae bacterium]
MFRGWGFLLSEIWVLIAVAALLGLFVGWLIWGRRAQAGASVDHDEAERLRAELTACQAKDRTASARIDALEADLADCRRAAVAVAPAAPVMAAEPEPEPDPEPAPAPAPAPETAPEAAADPAPAEVGTRPSRLDGPRDGVADDLKRIKGIGPKLEILCNRLGFWHFDQIANWSSEEIAWVDANLEAFKGRVTRDNWVDQARILAAEPRG